MQIPIGGMNLLEDFRDSFQIHMFLCLHYCESWVTITAKSLNACQRLELIRNRCNFIILKSSSFLIRTFLCTYLFLQIKQLSLSKLKIVKYLNKCILKHQVK